MCHHLPSRLILPASHGNTFPFLSEPNKRSSLFPKHFLHCVLRHSGLTFIAPPFLQSGIKIWDLESKSIVDELKPDFPNMGKKTQIPYCTSLNWSADGSTLYSGYTDGNIRVWGVGRV